MENIYFFLITFVIMFLILLIKYFIQNKKGSLNNSIELSLINMKYKLTKEEVKFVSLISVFNNSFIISLTAAITSALNLNYMWQILIGFILLMILIYITNIIIEKIISKRRKKNG